MKCSLSLLVVSAGLAVGCGGASHEPDSGSPRPDADTADAPTTPTPPPPCETPLAGDAPFGAHVRYDGPLYGLYSDSEVHWPVDADVYFPEGRRAGAPVILAGSTNRGIERADGMLDAALGSGEMSVLTGLHGRATGRLVGPTDGLLGEAYVFNPTTSWTDAGDEHAAPARFCPVGPLADASFRPVTNPIGPLSTIVLSPSAPVAPGASISVASSDGTVPTVTASTSLVHVTPEGAFPPGAPLTLDVTSTRDVLGRAFALATAVSVLSTSSTLDGFVPSTTPPATTALAGDVELIPSLDALTVRSIYEHSSFMLAFEAPDRPATIRVEGEIDCTLTDIARARAAIVRRDGSTVPWSIECTATSVEATVAPGEVVWLVLAFEPAPPLMPSSAGLGYPWAFALRSAVFE